MLCCAVRLPHVYAIITRRWGFTTTLALAGLNPIGPRPTGAGCVARPPCIRDRPLRISKRENVDKRAQDGLPHSARQSERSSAAGNRQPPCYRPREHLGSFCREDANQCESFHFLVVPRGTIIVYADAHNCALRRASRVSRWLISRCGGRAGGSCAMVHFQLRTFQRPVVMALPRVLARAVGHTPRARAIPKRFAWRWWHSAEDKAIKGIRP